MIINTSLVLLMHVAGLLFSTMTELIIAVFNLTTFEADKKKSKIASLNLLRIDFVFLQMISFSFFLWDKITNAFCIKHFY